MSDITDITEEMLVEQLQLLMQKKADLLDKVSHCDTRIATIDRLLRIAKKEPTDDR